MSEIPQPIKDRFEVIEYKEEARSSKWPNSVCLNCGKACEFRCTRCKIAFYCSQECQRKVAKVHNRICKRIAEEPLLYWQVKYPTHWARIAAVLVIADPDSRPEWAFLQEHKDEDHQIVVTGSLASKSEVEFRFDTLMCGLVNKKQVKNVMNKVHNRPKTIGFVVQSLHDKYSLCVAICSWEDCRTPLETIDIAKNNKTMKAVLNQQYHHKRCRNNDCAGCQLRKVEQDRENEEKQKEQKTEEEVVID